MIRVDFNHNKHKKNLMLKKILGKIQSLNGNLSLSYNDLSCDNESFIILLEKYSYIIKELKINQNQNVLILVSSPLIKIIWFILATLYKFKVGFAPPESLKENLSSSINLIVIDKTTGFIREIENLCNNTSFLLTNDSNNFNVVIGKENFYTEKKILENFNPDIKSLNFNSFDLQDLDLILFDNYIEPSFYSYRSLENSLFNLAQHFISLENSKTIMIDVSKFNLETLLYTISFISLGKEIIFTENEILTLGNKQKWIYLVEERNFSFFINTIFNSALESLSISKKYFTDLINKKIIYDKRLENHLSPNMKDVLFNNYIEKNFFKKIKKKILPDLHLIILNNFTIIEADYYLLKTLGIKVISSLSIDKILGPISIGNIENPQNNFGQLIGDVNLINHNIHSKSCAMGQKCVTLKDYFYNESGQIIVK